MNAFKLFYETSMGTASVQGLTGDHMFIKVADQYVVGSFPVVDAEGFLSWHWGHYFRSAENSAYAKAHALFAKMVGEEV